MNPYFTIADPHIIGQTLCAPLAVIRAPLFLPESINSLLFENHFLAWIACIIAGFVLTKLGTSRRQRRLMHMGFSVVMVTMLWMLAAYVVDTPAERLDQAHRRILAAAQRKDIAAIKAELADSFQFGPFDRAGLLQTVDASLKTFNIKSNIITSYDSQINNDKAASDLTVFSELDGASAGNCKTRWHLVWHDYGKDWQLLRIENWSLNDQPMPAGGGFPKAP